MGEEPGDSDSQADDEVLTPNELDITVDESVVEIDDGRYVISPGGGSPTVPSDPSGEGDRGEADAQSEDHATEGEALDLDAIHDWLGTYLSQADSKYSFDVTASFQGRSAQKALFSNDVVTTFENLVVWYAHHAGGETPVEDVIGILLAESNVTVRYPAESIRTVLDAHGLDTDDSVGDFVDAVEESGGITFPPDGG